jgi:HlyD family secretion protein
MSATVDVQTKKVSSVISVPIQSVTTRSDSSLYKEKEAKTRGDEGDIVVKNTNDKTENINETIKIEECVFLYSEGVVKLVKVKSGIQDNNYIEIIEGIKEGDEIISGPYSAISKELKDGTKVNKVDKSELFTVTKK